MTAIKPLKEDVKNFPDNPKAHIVLRKDGTLYVVVREYVYDKEKKRGRDGKTTYLGRIVDNVFYTMGEYHDKFMRGGAERVPSRETPNTPNESPKSGEVASFYLGFALLVYQAVKNTGLYEDLTSSFGEQNARLLITLVVYQCLFGNNAYYRVDELIRDFAIPWHGQELNKSALTTAAQALGDHQANLNRFFELRTARLNENEFVSYDGTSFDNGSEVGWNQKGKTKHGNIGNQIHFSYLLGHKSKFPVMFRIYPGNMNDLSTVNDFITQIKERMSHDHTSVLDRGYYSIDFLRLACKSQIKLLVAGKVEDRFIQDAVSEVREVLKDDCCFMTGHNCRGATVLRKIEDGDAEYSVWVHVYRRNPDREINDFNQSLKNFIERWDHHDKTVDDAPEMRFFIRPDGDIGEKPLIENTAVTQPIRDNYGYFSSVSTYETNAFDAINEYPNRDCIEKSFKFVKTDLGLDVNRGHSPSTIRFRLLIGMLTITVDNCIRSSMRLSSSVEQKNGKTRYIEPVAHSYSYNKLKDAFSHIELHCNVDGTYSISGITAKIKDLASRMRMTDYLDKLPDFVIKSVFKKIGISPK